MQALRQRHQSVGGQPAANPYDVTGGVLDGSKYRGRLGFSGSAERQITMTWQRKREFMFSSTFDMKVLIVSFWFPPANVVGAIRVGKLARYLDRHGYEVRVLTTNIGGDQSLPLGSAGTGSPIWVGPSAAVRQPRWV